MNCRLGCGACCVAPSITSFIPGMPNGKPAGVRCCNLSSDNACMIFARDDRPSFCTGLSPSPEMCGDSTQEALLILANLERLTSS